MGYIAHSFGVLGRFPLLLTPGTRLERVVKTRRFIIFWPFSWAIAHSFGVSGRFPLFVTPGTRFELVVKTRRFWIFWPAIAHSFRV